MGRQTFEISGTNTVTAGPKTKESGKHGKSSAIESWRGIRKGIREAIRNGKPGQL
jgi:hypothetical protein